MDRLDNAAPSDPNSFGAIDDSSECQGNSTTSEAEIQAPGPAWEKARRFLRRLDPDARQFTFQTFDDAKNRKDSSLARVIHGSLDDASETLAALNGRGAGVFVTVNETDGKGRRAENVVRVRAVWQDDDAGWAGEFPLEPHVIVETSPGKFQRYWLVDGLDKEGHGAVMARMVRDFGADPNAQDVARVLRLPGFDHRKGKPFRVPLVSVRDDPPYPAAAVLAAFPPVEAKNARRETKAATSNSQVREGGRNSFLTSQAGAMRRRGMAEEAILAALLAENDAKCGPPLDEAEVERIAASIMRYEPQADPLADAGIVANAIERQKDDPGAAFAPEVVEAARRLKANDPAEFQRLRARLKACKGRGSLTDWDRLVRGNPQEDDASGGGVADRLVEMIVRRTTLFHDREGRGFAAVEADGHTEILPIDSKSFAQWASFAHYEETKGDGSRGRAASEAALKQALLTVGGIAAHEGEEKAVYLRAAPWNGGYLVDIGDDAWRVVEVLPTGWRILDRSPVPFWRPVAARPLPIPAPGGDPDRLWEFANVPENCRALVLAWILEAWRSDTPFPVLELVGQQGTAKSSTQDKLRRLIDPNAVNLRAAPKSVEDIFVGAGGNWLVSFNNLSHLSAPQQDALCCLATGGGFAARTLYTNAEETLIECKRPVVMNGIAHLVTAQDLADRAIRVELQEIQYREETELEAAFAEALPSILGGLLDLFVATLAKLPEVKLERLPRMGDFARLGEATMRAQGHEEGEFMRLYEANRRESVARGVEASPAASAVLAMVRDSKEPSPTKFEGTVKALLSKLHLRRPFGGEAWPKSPKGLGDALRRQAPGLRALGVQVRIDAKPRHDGYHVEIVDLGREEGGD